MLFVQLDLKYNGSETSEPLIIGAAYRPPSSGEEYMDRLCCSIRDVSTKNKKSIMWIGGDFNLPDIDWEKFSVTGTQYPGAISNSLISIMSETGLDQVVSFPTRLDNTLDLFLTNRPSCINKCQPIPGISDHEIVYINTDVKPKRRKPIRRKIYLWNKVDLDQIHDEGNKMMKEFMEIYSSSSSVDEMWSTIESSLCRILELIPSKFTTIRFNQPWVTRKVKRLSRQKQRAYNQAVRCPPIHKERNWRRYRNLRKQMQKTCKDSYNKYINSIICPDIKSNPKRFWSYVSSKRHDNNGVSPLLGPRGAMYTGSRDKTNILNNQFCSVFNKEEDASTIPELGPNPFPQIDRISVSSSGVTKLLNNLNPHKATGPDKIPARLLKELADSIGPVLTILYQASLDCGTLPTIWKSATVVPVYKKGDRNKASNYRPISLTVICCKIIEHIIHSSIMHHLTFHNILTNCQHGFRKSRSCESQLIITVDDLAHNLDKNLQTDVILLDFSKAFDKVPHLRLLHKLQYYGICGSLLTWISNFLQGRVQRVVLDGQSSEQATVSSGVPQGTVLGPLFFLVYINDLPESIQSDSHIRLFADDCLIYRTIKSAEDASLLQNDLNNAQQWERDWMMEFHPEKCSVIHVTKRRNPINCVYTIHGKPLSAVPSAKYLGVEFTNKLSWNNHIDTTANKCLRSIGFLRRNLGNCSPDIKSRCYKTLVRPIAEYASCVWDPSTKKGITKVESIQRSAARYVKGDYSRKNSVSTMLSNLGWKSLQHRRQAAKATMMYRITNKLIDIPSNQLVPSYAATRGHSQKFVVPPARTNLLKGTFFPDTIRLWNSLPSEVVDSPTIDIFKNRISIHL